MSRSTDRRPALFLDRDGVINEDPGWISSPDRLVIFPFSAEAIALANRAGFLVIVISNQSVIARGLATEETVDAVNTEMETQLGKNGARVDAVYYCPHHPEFSGPCRCRKPQTGLIERAVSEHDVDLEGSYLVGDTTGDLLTGKSAGLRTVLVRTGKAGTDGQFEVQPDYSCDHLLEAVHLIIETSEGSSPMREGEGG